MDDSSSDGEDRDFETNEKDRWYEFKLIKWLKNLFKINYYIPELVNSRFDNLMKIR